MSTNNNNQPVVTFSTDDYVIPKSSALPKYQFFFQIIKDGSIVNTVKIKKKEFHLIGRLEDLCDIFVDNPTVSRKHAILQFHKQDPLPSLFDLGSAQGTFVNKQLLPPRAYKKLQLFSNIKFGVSSRYYLLRCPQLQQKQNQQEEQKENQFVKTLAQQNKMLSKQQMKSKYLQLLENDPYFGGQLKSRLFQGQKKSISHQNNGNQNDEGISWGIGDQTQVYAYKNQRQFPIEPDVLRRLPGLDHTTLQRIAQYEQKFRIYDEIEGQLNELSNKQKKQFGLQEKLQGRKQKLEKRFLQSLQALQKCQDWIRINIFGDESSHLQKKKKKQKQRDTFSDDEFYDRTLENKNEKKDEKVSQKKRVQNEQATVEDLWMLKNRYIAQLTRKKQLLLLNPPVQKQTPQSDNIQPQQQQQQQQADQLQLYMKKNQQNLQEQNKNIYQRQTDLIQQNLRQIKQKLLKFLSQKQITKIEQTTLNPQKIKQKQQKKKLKQAQQKQHLSKTLQRIQAEQKQRRLREQRRRKLQQQCTDQYSQKMFDLYKQDANQQQQQRQYQYDDDNQQKPYKRPSIMRSHYTNQTPQQNKPRKKVHFQSQQHYQPLQQQNQQKPSQQQKVFDLTQNFK